jgi:hypothetical protein
VKFDGTDYPYMMTGNTGVQTISFSPIDRFTARYVIKTDGEALNSGTSTVSSDGKTYRVEGKVSDAQGRINEYLYVYDRE